MVIPRDRMLLTAIAIVLALSGRTTVSSAQPCRTRNAAQAEGPLCVTRTSAESSSARPLVGFVDPPTHPMANFGFGGKLLYGGVDIGSLPPSGAPPDARIGLPRNLATVFVPPRPFNTLVLGDSYMWEPGLRMEEKSFWLVWQHIAAELGGFRAATRPRVFARSGAIIGGATANTDSCWQKTSDNAAKDAAAPWPGGPLPDAYWDDSHPEGDHDYAAPSIWGQLSRATNSQRPDYVSPADVDLVLIDGGGNDVGVFHIIDPTTGKNGHEGIRTLTRWCVGRMRQLLPAVASTFPNAQIVLIGYPQVVDYSTNSFTLLSYIGMVAAAGGGVALGAAIPGTTGVAAGGILAVGTAPVIKEMSRGQSQAFAIAANEILQDIASKTPRALFADVRQQWGDINAYGAPNSFFWHFTAPARPPDHTADERTRICNLHGHLVTGGTSDLFCIHGAAGHPNVDGAKAYANVVLGALDGLGVGWLGLKPILACLEGDEISGDVAAPLLPPAMRPSRAHPAAKTEDSDAEAAASRYATFTVTTSELAGSPKVEATMTLGGASFPANTPITWRLCSARRVSNGPTGRGSSGGAWASDCLQSIDVHANGFTPVTFPLVEFLGRGRAPLNDLPKHHRVCAPTAKPGTLRSF